MFDFKSTSHSKIALVWEHVSNVNDTNDTNDENLMDFHTTN